MHQLPLRLKPPNPLQLWLRQQALLLLLKSLKPLELSLKPLEPSLLPETFPLVFFFPWRLLLPQPQPPRRPRHGCTDNVVELATKAPRYAQKGSLAWNSHPTPTTRNAFLEHFQPTMAALCPKSPSSRPPTHSVVALVTRAALSALQELFARLKQATFTSANAFPSHSHHRRQRKLL
jgi:hypothetical protein